MNFELASITVACAFYAQTLVSDLGWNVCYTTCLRTRWMIPLVFRLVVCPYCSLTWNEVNSLTCYLLTRKFNKLILAQSFLIEHSKIFLNFALYIYKWTFVKILCDISAPWFCWPSRKRRRNALKWSLLNSRRFHGFLATLFHPPFFPVPPLGTP